MRKSPRQEGHPFWAEWLHHARPLLLITLIIVLLEGTPILEGVGSLGVDRMIRSYPVDAPREIFLVEITDENYRAKEYFNNSSPLAAAKVAILLQQIERLGPRVIGVDLDTEDESFSGNTQIEELRRQKNIVWAVVPKILRGEKGANQSFILEKSADAIQAPNSALPNFPRDEDGVVRKFRDAYSVVRDNDEIKLPSLGCAVAYLGDFRRCTTDPKSHRFSIVGGHETFQTVAADQFLQPDFPDGSDNPIHGKIVLVGGNYGAARDMYVTPAGELPGVEVVANAAQSYLKGGRSILDSPIWIAALFDLAIGTVVIGLYWAFRLRIAFWLNIAAVPLAMGISFVVFRVFGYWLAFAPVLLGMLIHELHYHAEHIGELEEAGEGNKSSFIFVNISYRIQRLLRYLPPDRS